MAGRGRLPRRRHRYRRHMRKIDDTIRHRRMWQQKDINRFRRQSFGAQSPGKKQFWHVRTETVRWNRSCGKCANEAASPGVQVAFGQGTEKTVTGTHKQDRSFQHAGSSPAMRESGQKPFRVALMSHRNVTGIRLSKNNKFSTSNLANGRCPDRLAPNSACGHKEC